MIQLNDKEIVAVEKDLDTRIDVGVNGILANDKKPAIYLNDRRVYPEPNTAVTINGSSVTVPDRCRYFTFSFLSNLPPVRYSDGSDYLKADGSNYAITDFPFMVFDSDVPNLFLSLWLQDISLYEENYYVMPDSVIFYESISGNVREDRDIRIDRVSDPTLPRTEQNKWRIYGVNLGTRTSLTKYFLARVIRDDYNGQATGTWVYNSGPASGKTAITYDYDTETKMSRSTFYPLIKIQGNSAKELETYYSFDPLGLTLNANDPNNNVLYYDREFPMDRTYHLSTVYTSGAIEEGSTPKECPYIYPEDRTEESFFPEMGNVSVALSQSYTWISGSGVDISAGVNTTSNNRTANVSVTYEESGKTSTKSSTIMQWRKPSSFNTENMTGFTISSTTVRENEETVGMEFEAGEYFDASYGSNASDLLSDVSYTVKFNIGNRQEKWHDGYMPNSGISSMEVYTSYDADGLGQGESGRCYCLSTANTVCMLIKTTDGLVQWGGTAQDPMGRYQYDEDTEYVYCYLEDDAEHFEIVDYSEIDRTSSYTPRFKNISYETIEVDGTEYRMKKLKYEPSIGRYEFYVFPNDEAWDDIDANVVINVFDKKATKNNDDVYVEVDDKIRVNTAQVCGYSVYSQDAITDVMVEEVQTVDGEPTSVRVPPKFGRTFVLSLTHKA